MKNNYISPNINILLGVISVSAVFFPSVASATTFNYTGAIDSYTVPTSGMYNIDILGAQGGNNGGLGGKLAGSFNLNAGEILSILVGGIGANGNGGASGGGGGFFGNGSGSGGGGGFSFINGGGFGSGFGSGGNGGFGGGGGGGDNGSGGGGGGGNFGGYAALDPSVSSGGGIGGSGTSSLTRGGSGGNGGGNGGLGGYDSTRLATVANLISSDAVHTGNGSVTISSFSAPTSVPEPFTIIGTLVGGTAAIRMRKKLKKIAN